MFVYIGEIWLLVDIGTEWNLEIGKYLCASKHTYVDIGTEWNLE